MGFWGFFNTCKYFFLSCISTQTDSIRHHTKKTMTLLCKRILISSFFFIRSSYIWNLQYTLKYNNKKNNKNVELQFKKKITNMWKNIQSFFFLQRCKLNICIILQVVQCKTHVHTIFLNRVPRSLRCPIVGEGGEKDSTVKIIENLNNIIKWFLQNNSKTNYCIFPCHLTIYQNFISLSKMLAQILT